MQTTLFKEPEPIQDLKILKKTRKYLGWPCDIAQDLPIDERPEHIKDCDECSRLLAVLEEKIGVK